MFFHLYGQALLDSRLTCLTPESKCHREAVARLQTLRRSGTPGGRLLGTCRRRLACLTISVTRWRGSNGRMKEASLWAFFFYASESWDSKSLGILSLRGQLELLGLRNEALALMSVSFLVEGPLCSCPSDG